MDACQPADPERAMARLHYATIYIRQQNRLRWFEQKMKLLKQRFEVVLLTIDSVK
jgi:hypothetical protein